MPNEIKSNHLWITDLSTEDFKSYLDIIKRHRIDAADEAIKEFKKHLFDLISDALANLINEIDTSFFNTEEE